MYLVHGIIIYQYCQFHLENALSLSIGFTLIIGLTIPMAYMVYNLDNRIRAKYFV